MKQLVAKLDKPSPQVLLEVKILAVDVTDTNARAIDFLFSGGSLSAGFADGLPTVSGGGQAIQASNSLLIPQGSGIDTQAAIFNAITENFRARVQMLEKEGRITRLATPNLLVSDNEASKLFVGQEVTVMQKAERTLTYTNSSSGAQNPNLSWNIDAPRRKIGISLVITPKIHADRTVTVRLLQERSALGDMRENVYSGGESQEEGDLLDTETTSTADSSTSESRYFLSQDIDMQAVTTTVVGKDGKIMVIGGFIEETAEKEVQKLPWLSELPVLGELLFTRFEEVRKRSEIIVVIRPFVLLAPGEGTQISKTFMKRISLHPSARDDIPALGLMRKKNIAKGSRINPNDPWYKRLLQRLDVWKIDRDTAPELENELREYHIRKDDSETMEAIEKLKQYEQKSQDKAQEKSQDKNKEQENR
jgi:general secretion pathway protein D